MNGGKYVLVLLAVVSWFFVYWMVVRDYPKAWTEEQIREYLTKERVFSDLFSAERNQEDCTVRAEGLGFSITFTKKDLDDIDLTIERINDTSYSVYGDEFHYTAILRFNHIQITDDECRAVEVVGDINTEYNGGGGRYAIFKPKSARYLD